MFRLFQPDLLRKRGMRVVKLRSQSTFDSGALMCTSACVCVSVAAVTGVIGPGSESDPELRRKVENIMGIASNAHAKIEKIKDSKRRRATDDGEPARRHYMVGAEEVLGLLDIDLEKAGLGVETLVICRDGQGTKFKRDEDRTKEEARVPLKSMPESCLIGIDHLPDCLVARDGAEGCGLAATVTVDLHTIAVACSAGGVYSIYDPMPAAFVVGMTRAEFVKEILGLCRAGGDGGPVQADVSVFYVRPRTDDTPE